MLTSGSASDKAEQLVAFARHRLVIVGLHVETEERFGVRGAEVEPPVPEIHGEAVEVVYLHALVFGEVVFDLLDGGLLVFDLGVDLAGKEVRVYGGDEVRDAALLAAD